MAVNVLMRELGIDFTLEPQMMNGSLHPRLAKINPRGSVPVIQDDGFAIREGGAILTWLCDEYDKEAKFLPKSGQERALALQWLMVANATLHPTYGRYFYLSAKEETQEIKALKEETLSAIQKLWDELEKELEGKDYICGDKMSVADILLSVIANWAPNKHMKIHYGSNCKGLFQRVSSREAFQEALKAEEVPYKASA